MLNKDKETLCMWNISRFQKDVRLGLLFGPILLFAQNETHNMGLFYDQFSVHIDPATNYGTKINY